MEGLEVPMFFILTIISWMFFYYILSEWVIFCREMCDNRFDDTMYFDDNMS